MRTTALTGTGGGGVGVGVGPAGWNGERRGSCAIRCHGAAHPPILAHCRANVRLGCRALPGPYGHPALAHSPVTLVSDGRHVPLQAGTSACADIGGPRLAGSSVVGETSMGTERTPSPGTGSTGYGVSLRDRTRGPAIPSRAAHSLFVRNDHLLLRPAARPRRRTVGRTCKHGQREPCPTGWRPAGDTACTAVAALLQPVRGFVECCNCRSHELQLQNARPPAQTTRRRPRLTRCWPHQRCPNPGDCTGLNVDRCQPTV